VATGHPVRQTCCRVSFPWTDRNRVQTRTVMIMSVRL
jgi:hypothetical protein